MSRQVVPGSVCLYRQMKSNSCKCVINQAWLFLQQCIYEGQSNLCVIAAKQSLISLINDYNVIRWESIVTTLKHAVYWTNACTVSKYGIHGGTELDI